MKSLMLMLEEFNQEHGPNSQKKHGQLHCVLQEWFVPQETPPDVSPDIDEIACNKCHDVILRGFTDSSQG